MEKRYLCRYQDSTGKKFAVVNKYPDTYTSNDVEKDLRQKGFKSIKVRDLSKD